MGAGSMDRMTETLLAALKQALAEPAEQRLYRSGKLAGLFPGKAAVNAEAAARALQDGLLEVVRTETKGKTTLDWVRITPKGVNYLHDQEAPVQVLRELRAALHVNRQGLPTVLAELHQELHALGNRLVEQVQSYGQRLEALERRVEEALRRADLAGPSLPDGVAAALPWAAAALEYLDRRRKSGAPGACPLPELFAALREQHGSLSLTDFHDGLRRLHDRHALRLTPAEPGQPLPEPEHALLDGEAVYYYAAHGEA